MGGVKLLEEARAAGLRVRAEGDRLIVRGPKSAEPVAKALLEKKAEVLVLLHQQPDHRAMYRDMAEAVEADCFLIDPCWLVDQHPDLWRQIRELDDQLSRMEREGVAEPAYRNTLQRLYDAVCQARALFAQERAEPVQQ